MEKTADTIRIVEDHVVVQLGGAGGGELEDLEGTGGRDDGVGGGDGRDDVLHHPLGQAIRDSQNAYKRMTRSIKDMSLSSLFPPGRL